jgi:hypothetical protein
MAGMEDKFSSGEPGPRELTEAQGNPQPTLLDIVEKMLGGELPPQTVGEFVGSRIIEVMERLPKPAGPRADDAGGAWSQPDRAR